MVRAMLSRGSYIPSPTPHILAAAGNERNPLGFKGSGQNRHARLGGNPKQDINPMDQAEGQKAGRLHRLEAGTQARAGAWNQRGGSGVSGQALSSVPPPRSFPRLPTASSTGAGRSSLCY